MYCKETDYYYRDKLCDIIDHLNILEQDILSEIYEREQGGDFDDSILRDMQADINRTLSILNHYRKE